MRKYVIGLLAMLVIIWACLNVSASGLSTIADITTIVSSIVLVVIALLLYNKFNGSQALVDEQTKRVVDLVGKMNQARFFVEDHTKGQAKGVACNIRVIDYKQRRKGFVEIFGKDIHELRNLANETILDFYSFMSDSADDPYLPRVIADELRKRFYFGMFEHVPTKDLPDAYLKIWVNGDFGKVSVFGEETRLSKDLIGSIYGDSKHDFEMDDLMYNFESIQRASMLWLKRNNKAIAESINIEEVKKFRPGVDIY